MPRTRTRQEQTATNKFVHDNARITFSDGTMHVNGQPMWPDDVANFLSSNKLTTYTAIVWRDVASGERRTSCNCPGWTIKRRGQPRQCTHTKDLEGIKPCSRPRVSSTSVQSVAQAVELVPDIAYGKCLRAIDLD
jgi:hypothetical protein